MHELALFIAILGQIPPPEQLPADDIKPFHDEIERIEERMLETAGDKPTVLYALARTWAAGKEYRKAFEVLEKVAALRVGLDPSNDPIFDKIKGAKEYQRLLDTVRADTPRISRSTVAFTIDEEGLAPEGMAYSPRLRRFLLGSVVRPKIVSCRFDGKCHTLVAEGRDGLGEVLGLRVDPRDGTLWVANNTAAQVGVFHYALPSGQLIRKYTGDRKGREFNDLAVDLLGNVFITDSAGGAVYWIDHQKDRLELFNPALQIHGANGITLSGTGKLYVAGFPDGITVVDVASRSFHAMAHPPNLCLATIDGLYFSNDSLYAIQNSVMVHRAVRFHLTPELDAIDGFEILERRNPLFDGPTTAALMEGAFYLVANPQTDKVKPGDRLQPLKVLRIDLTTKRKQKP